MGLIIKVKLYYPRLLHYGTDVPKFYLVWKDILVELILGVLGVFLRKWLPKNQSFKETQKLMKSSKFSS